ncbi:MAG: metallophosphoesterase [Bacteroidota bacterium]
MKILAMTDIHGAYEKAERIIEKEAGISAVIVGGDLTTNGSAEEARSALQRFAKFDVPIIVVAGNMDPPELETVFSSNAISINACGTMLDDVGVFGVSGSPFTPMHTPYEISEEEISFRAHSGWKDIQAARVKIFVPHAPPHNTKLDRLRSGDHVGSTSVRKFVEQFRPDAVVSGHIHESRGIDTLQKTVMVNCGSAASGFYAVLTIGKEVSAELKG